MRFVVQQLNFNLEIKLCGLGSRTGDMKALSYSKQLLSLIASNLRSDYYSLKKNQYSNLKHISKFNDCATKDIKSFACW